MKKTFTTPSGTEFTYRVDDDGRLLKDRDIEFGEDACTIAGVDLIALAIHLIEGEIEELEVEQLNTHVVDLL